MRLRKRHRLRKKQINALATSIDELLGCKSFSTEDTVDKAKAPDLDIIFINGDPLAMVIEDMPFLSVRGLIRYGASSSYVEVDMGAVPYVINGADIMAPGIVDADPGIVPEDLVWIRDQKNLKPLAVGRALLAGPDMVSSKSGKAVKNIHYYGDALWNLGT